MAELCVFCFLAFKTVWSMIGFMEDCDNRNISFDEEWYVIFVKTGNEKNMVSRLNSYFCNYIAEAFLPYMEIYHKYANKIVRKELKLMFPGYVFIKSSLGELDFFHKLKKFVLDTSSKLILLSYSELEHYAMTKEDRAFFDDLFDENITMEASAGVICGDKVIITEGPLIGRESIIKKINRHKREATIEINIMGRSSFVTVGLDIISKIGN